jgi:hypothetical protein
MAVAAVRLGIRSTTIDGLLKEIGMSSASLGGLTQAVASSEATPTAKPNGE